MKSPIIAGGMIADGNPAFYMPDMPDKKLTDADRAELARILRQSIDRDRFPLSPRVQHWKELLSKIDPAPPAAAEPYPPAKAWVNSSIGQRKRRP